MSEKEKPIKLVFTVHEDQIVFTTNYENVYKLILERQTHGANETEDEMELNGYHCQCWFDFNSFNLEYAKFITAAVNKVAIKLLNKELYNE